MAFHGLTPESLLDRTDSKNPATTCKGLTANGRPCRRGLGSTPGGSPGNTPTRRSSNNQTGDVDEPGVVAIIDSSNAAAFFCWQHKDQAQNLIARIESQQQQQQQPQQQHASSKQRTRIVPLQKRSSIDTLIEKVGIIDLDEDVPDRPIQFSHTHRSTHQRSASRPNNVRIRKRETLPPEWQGIQGPLMSVPEEVVHEVAPYSDSPRRRSRSRSRSRTRMNARESRQEKSDTFSARTKPKPKTTWICCGFANDGYNDDGPPARRRERYNQHRPSTSRSRLRPSMSNARPGSYSADTGYRTPPQPAMQERPRQPSQTNTSMNEPSRPSIPYRTYDLQSTPPAQRNGATLNPSKSAPFPISPTTPTHTQTSHFLSLIPPNLDPTTTSALLTELSKPFAKDDDEGYIYIYWLTPSSEANANANTNTANTTTIEDKPDDDLASTILDSESESESESDFDSNSKASWRPGPSQPRRQSQPHKHTTLASKTDKQTKQALLTRYASLKQPSSSLLPSPSHSPTTPSNPPKILLKIGRATNVHRRMTQWSKQCGQNITLIRWYPHVSSRSMSQSADSPSLTANQVNPRINGNGNTAVARKVNHVNRVERLIHIELRGLGMGYDVAREGSGSGERKRCEVCGRGHREWFEVEGTREGLKRVDTVVRRWVEWGGM